MLERLNSMKEVSKKEEEMAKVSLFFKKNTKNDYKLFIFIMPVEKQN